MGDSPRARHQKPSSSRPVFGSPEFVSKTSASEAAPLLDKRAPDPWPFLSVYYEYLGASTTIPANLRNRSVSYRCRSCSAKVAGYMSSTNGLKRHQIGKHSVTPADWGQVKDRHKMETKAEAAAAAAGGPVRPAVSHQQQHSLSVSVASSSGAYSAMSQSLGSPPTGRPLERYLHSGDKLNEMILDLIVGQCLSFRLVETPEFLAIMREFFPTVKCFTRRQISDRVQVSFGYERDRLRSTLQQQRWVAATADCWTGPNIR